MIGYLLLPRQLSITYTASFGGFESSLRIGLSFGAHLESTFDHRQSKVVMA